MIVCSILIEIILDPTIVSPVHSVCHDEGIENTIILITIIPNLTRPPNGQYLKHFSHADLKEGNRKQ